MIVQSKPAFSQYILLKPCRSKRNLEQRLHPPPSLRFSHGVYFQEETSTPQSRSTAQTQQQGQVQRMGLPGAAPVNKLFQLLCSLPPHSHCNLSQTDSKEAEHKLIPSTITKLKLMSAKPRKLKRSLQSGHGSSSSAKAFLQEATDPAESTRRT